MPRLSNFFRSRDPADPSAGTGLSFHQVQRPQIESALRLILANDQGLANDETVLDFLAFALQRKIDVNQIWIAEERGRVLWALLPITSPGRTMLMFTPGRIPSYTTPQVACVLLDHVCAHSRDQGMHLAQFLLDPADSSVRQLYVDCGFEVLAELIYLHRPLNGEVQSALPQGFEISNYSTLTHPQFAAAILRSYEGSLDCPNLNGRRQIEDVIEGHKATGTFDPNLWHLITESGDPRGVLILSAAAHTESLELVYLGLVPEARHRGLGDALMRIALGSGERAQKSELSLAVDSHNAPALRLYYRHGMKKIGSRIAMVRDLRS
jgi:GNAT superfamily N-acetyltransferase